MVATSEFVLATHWLTVDTKNCKVELHGESDHPDLNKVYRYGPPKWRAKTWELFDRLTKGERIAFKTTLAPMLALIDQVLEEIYQDHGAEFYIATVRVDGRQALVGLNELPSSLHDAFPSVRPRK